MRYPRIVRIYRSRLLTCLCSLLRPLPSLFRSFFLSFVRSFVLTFLRPPAFARSFVYPSSYRLVDYGVTIILIDEFRTSKYLYNPDMTAEGGVPLEKAFSKLNKERYGVLRYPREGQTHDLYVHRDKNAAKNIRQIFLSLVIHGRRPPRFSRPATAAAAPAPAPAAATVSAGGGGG